MTMGKKDKKRRKGKKRVRMADKADRYELYLASVQAPDVDVEYFDEVYREYFKKKPSVLREDFCGTAAICCEWVKMSPKNFAYGIDLDPEPLAWGREHNLTKLKQKQRERVHLIEGDVRTAKSPQADVVCAQNFSYFLFKTRDELRRYFKKAHYQLAERGVFVVDLFGGYESMEDNREDVHEHDGFDYVWDQVKFDPITHDALFHIHFRFDDGSELKKAFEYDWRFWTIPEVREVMLEVGFDKADVFWEGTDKNGDGDGVFTRAEKGECDPAWNAYVIGVKGR
jgi:SAM-dependent methyltransferase